MKKENEVTERRDQINVNRNMEKKGNVSQQDSTKNYHKIEVASQSDLGLVKFDLLKLVGEFQKQGEFSFERRYQDGYMADLGGGCNFMEGSIHDLFGVQQQNQVNELSEQKILELQECIRCDTDLIQLVKQNLNNTNMRKSVSFSSPSTLKKKSILTGMNLVRMSSSSNIKEESNNLDDTLGMGDDEYKLSPISRKQSMQITLNTFGDFGLTSLGNLEKGLASEQISSCQNSDSESSAKSESKVTNTQIVSSQNLISNEKNTNNQYNTEDKDNNQMKFIVKRQSSVRFMLPMTNLEKIRETDEKDEDMQTKNSQTESSSPDKIRSSIIREKKISVNSSGILKGILTQRREEIPQKTEEVSTFSSEDDYEEGEDQLQNKQGNELISKYLNGSYQDENDEGNIIPKLSLRFSEQSQSGFIQLSSANSKQRSSLFFSQNARFLDVIPQDEYDKLTEEQDTKSDLNNDKSNFSKSISNSRTMLSPTGRTAIDRAERKNTYLQKRQSAYIKIEDLQKQKQQEMQEDTDNTHLQPRLYHSNTLRQPGTPGNNASSLSNNNSYVTYFKKTPDQSVIETSKIKKEVDDDGKKIINSYTLLHELGRGGFGKVKLASSEFPTDHGVIVKYFAIKVSNKQTLKRKLISMKVNAYTLLEREVAIMKKIDHPHLVKLHEVIDDPDDDKIYMVMEYMQKGSILSTAYWKKELKETDNELYEKIFEGDEHPNKKKLEMLPKKLTVEKSRKYFQQFALAIDYMHNFAQVIHRDIKPENILIDENDNLKIADFGVSHIMETNEDSDMKDNAGTKAFTAPEGWTRNFKGKPLDMWASGVTLYNMVFGELPFFHKDQMKLKNLIINEEVKIPQDTDPDLADLVKKLLIKNPDSRLTAQEMLVNIVLSINIYILLILISMLVKQHPWLTVNGTIHLQNSDSSAKDIQISMSDLQSAFTKKIQLSTLIRVKFKLNRQLTRARSFLYANQSAIGLDTSLNHDRYNTDPNTVSPVNILTNK